MLYAAEAVSLLSATVQIEHYIGLEYWVLLITWTVLGPAWDWIM